MMHLMVRATLGALFLALSLVVAACEDPTGASAASNPSPAPAARPDAAVASSPDASFPAQAAAPAPDKSASPPALPAAPPRKTPSVMAGCLEVCEALHDFGEIWDVAPVRYIYQLRNPSAKSISIVEMRPGCSCTKATLSKYTIAPGETIDLDVTFNPRGMTGRQTKDVSLVTTDPAAQIVKVAFTSMIKVFASSNPRFINPKEPVAPGQKHVFTFHVVCPTDPDFTISKIAYAGIDPSHVTARELPRDPAAAARGIPVEVTIDERAPWGGLYAQIDVTVRGRPGPGQEPITGMTSCNVALSLYNKLIASDNMARIGVVAPGASWSKNVRISHREGRHFTLKASIRDGFPEGQSVQVVPIAASSVAGYELVLTGASGTHLGQIGGWLDLETDVPGEERISLRIQGLVRDVKTHSP